MWLNEVLNDDDLCERLAVDLRGLGIDLVDYFRKKVTYREIIWCMKHLPNTSLLKQELGRRELGDEVKWDQKDYLSAANANATRDVVYLTSLLVWLKGGGKGPEPKQHEPIRPPGWVAPKPRMLSTEEAAEFFNSL